MSGEDGNRAVHPGLLGRIRRDYIDAAPRDRRNSARLVRWSMAWAVVLVGSTAIQIFGHIEDVAMWLLAVLPLFPAIMAVASYMKLLREADELVRRVQLEGLAIGFGAGLIAMMGIQFPRNQFDPDVWHTAEVLVMVFGWVAGQIWATRRYK